MCEQAVAFANQDLEADVASWQLRKLERDILQLQGNMSEAAREKVWYVWKCACMWVTAVKNIVVGAVRWLKKTPSNWAVVQLDLHERLLELEGLQDELSGRHQETLAERDELRDLLDHLRPEMLHELVSLDFSYAITHNSINRYILRLQWHWAGWLNTSVLG